MDASSELVHALLPLFMVVSLGASIFVVGIVEGVAEATAMIVMFSGYASDVSRRRKPLVLLGYGLGAYPSSRFHWRMRSAGSSAHVSPTGSARASAAHRATR